MPKDIRGGRRASGGAEAPRNDAEEVVQPVDALKNLKGRITKVAQEAFTFTYRRARLDMPNRSPEERLSVLPNFGERGYVSMQTLRGYQHLIDAERRNNDIDLRLGVRTQEDVNNRRRALNALQRGLNNSYEQHRKFWKGEF